MKRFLLALSLFTLSGLAQAQIKAHLNVEFDRSLSTDVEGAVKTASTPASLTLMLSRPAESKAPKLMLKIPQAAIKKIQETKTEVVVNNLDPSLYGRVEIYLEDHGHYHAYELSKKGKGEEAPKIKLTSYDEETKTLSGTFTFVAKALDHDHKDVSHDDDEEHIHVEKGIFKTKLP